jgi:predicted AlkP superfamily pyrophosphatase or phosphodiesterase
MVRALSLLAGLAVLAVQPAAQTPASRHVILVTIDGLRGDYLSSTDPYHLKIPTLRGLIREGSASDRTISVFPTLTGTAHTTLVTGVPAARHGILGNNRFDPSVWTWGRENYDLQPPYRDFAHVKAPTLWAAVRASGGTTAALNWPQTAGAPIDFMTDVVVGRSVDTLLGPVNAANVRMADHYRALVAAETLVKRKPAFMAVHFSQTDTVQHAIGPGTPEALVALEDTDTNIGVVVEAARRGGIAADTTMVITGDHGFLPFHTELAINLPLVEAGLIAKGPDGHPQWQAMIAPNRGLGSVYVRDGAERAAVIARVREVLSQYERRFPGRFRLVERDELNRLGADGDAVFGVEPVRGYVLDGRLSPPFAQAHNRAAGHGYSPATPGMETGLVMSGAGVRRGVRLAETRTLDVAPTIAALLGIELRQAEGQPIAGALK